MHYRAAGLQGWSAQHNLESGIYLDCVEHRLELFRAHRNGRLTDITNYIGEVVKTTWIGTRIFARRQ